MSYNDLRKGRFSEVNRVYFITTNTYHRLNLFNDFNTARIVVNSMRKLNDCGYVDSLSWVVMPDHLHWLIQLSDEYPLAEIIKRLKAQSAHSINRYLNRSGPVWQRSYYDRAIRKEEDIKGVSRYIVANPIRAGLVSKTSYYPHWDAVWF